MGDGCREGGEGRDADVRACTRRWARGGENKDRQPNVPEYEPDETACNRGGKAPECDRCEEKSVQALEYP